MVGDAFDRQLANREAARGVSSSGRGFAGVVLAIPVRDEAVQPDEEILFRRLPREHADEFPLLVVDAQAEHAGHRRRHESDADAGCFLRWRFVFLGQGRCREAEQEQEEKSEIRNPKSETSGAETTEYFGNDGSRTGASPSRFTPANIS